MPEERNNMVIVTSDVKDASNLENVKKAMVVMEDINNLRAEDDNFSYFSYNPAGTNFYFMAAAQNAAMKGVAQSTTSTPASAAIR